MLALGTQLQPFSLQGFNREKVTDPDLRTVRAPVVAFVCPDCPHVEHVRSPLAQLAKEYQPRHIAIIAINSNDV